jgi:hypothetical protein
VSFRREVPVLFSEDTSALFRRPADGGEEKQVAPVAAAWVRLYFFSDANTLQLLDETTGLIRIVARLDGHSAQNGITVSPDSAYLAFSERSSLRNDLMLVEGFR